jgi:heterodisulfide reductase subunit B
MDLSPTRIMRLLQLEEGFSADPQQAEVFAQQALGADTCWLCAGCMACTTRCPQGVDIAGTMDVLRQESLRRGLASKSKRAKDIQALHRSFLGGVLSRGRIHEISLVMEYKLRTWHFFQDALNGAVMFFKGKLHLKPEPAQDMSRVQKAIGQLRQQKGSAEA